MAWTLRQDPSIRRIRLTADGESLPGLSREIRVDKGAEYDPAASPRAPTMFALREGRVVGGDRDDLRRSTGRSVSATTA